MKKLSLSQLEQHLSHAAWILKGPVDAADFKAYIFPLLFFKRISDVYDEEFAQALAESEGDADYAALAELHRFVIPDGCHWRDVREVSTNVGEALQAAFRGIESANPKQLYGIFGDAPWTNREKLPDGLLINLIEHFSQYNLSNDAVEPDILGQSYEYLIKHFADLTNKKAGEFYTPRSVVHLIGLILDAQEGESIYDPAAGTGGMLLECTEHLRQAGRDYRTLRMFGQEKNLTTSTIARMNLFLHGIEDFQIARGDTLRYPAFVQHDQLRQFDCVVANPPFSLKEWGVDEWSADPFGRNFAGVPPKSNGDMAWVQHMISSMKPDRGRMAVVLPHGALFRKGAEGRIRQALIEQDKLDAVIGLGANIFYGTTLAACLLVFRAQKPAERRGKILFIDASNQVRVGRAQNFLESEHVDTIYGWYAAGEDVPHHARLVDAAEVAQKDFNLNIPLYIEKAAGDALPSLDEALTQLETAAQAAWQAEDRFRKLLGEFELL
ncbi:SAM-dependent DNA methyltransferase [Hymenobacter busanensis]|uniref:site-specific DNA-methyltransferase (adenine-specific) n=1 Tax=Hymenobacter busanensis TaxID=2607656 RepID=A0A7L5A4M1_9BACT|nr:class I SAM-dependent DNA methyltransferase [Hymenobacter busanensis]KAA9338443.1 SAM-dependent DNA methyltransferase [Hymenobacter busanensis]QHJ09130.1 N-6 DNA methylase [Hymenobacter busanensis]